MNNELKICKVNNKLCNVNNLKYNENTKELFVDYKVGGWKEYKNFSSESYNKLLKENSENKTLGKLLKKELESNKK